MQGRFLRLGAAAVMLVLAGAPAAEAVPVEDTDGPELVSVQRSGVEAVSKHVDSTWLEVVATDPSGVAAVDALIRRDGPSTEGSSCDPYIRGLSRQGTGKWLLSLCGFYPPTIGPSSVTVEKLILRDSQGNTTEVSDRAILDPLSYRIENADYEGDAPVLESVTVEPAAALPGQDVVVTMRVREASGSLNTHYQLAEPLLGSRGSQLIPEDRQERRNGDGTYTIVDTYTTDQDTRYGEYALGDVYLHDYWGNSLWVPSGAAISVQDPEHPMGAPAIIGDTVVGGALRAESGTPDPAAKVEYIWAHDQYSEVPPGGPSFRLLPAHAAKDIVLRVTATWPDGTVRRRNVVTGPVRKGTLGIGAVALKGTAAVGSTLTAQHQEIDPAKHPNPVSAYHAYTWLRDGKPIGDQWWKTYTPTAADMGHTLSVRVRSEAPGYDLETAESAMVKVAAGTLTAPTPTISGAAGAGSTFTAAAGNWTAGASLKYQWLHNGRGINGAIWKTYTSTQADLNQVLQVRVTGSKDGYTTATRTSPALRPVTGKLSTSTPRIDGTVRVGRKVTATVPTGWTDGSRLTYQWQRDSRNISGATGRTYNVVAADRGQQVRVRISGSKTGYTLATRYSAARKAGYGVLNHTPPVLSGAKRVGYRMAVNPGTWTTGTTLRYQWLRDGSKIPGASSRTYMLRAADRGKAVSVRVSGSKPGYWTVTNESRTFAVR